MDGRVHGGKESSSLSLAALTTTCRMPVDVKIVRGLRSQCGLSVCDRIGHAGEGASTGDVLHVLGARTDTFVVLLDMHKRRIEIPQDNPVHFVDVG